MERHTEAPIFRASSHGNVRTLADTVSATPAPTISHSCNIWVVVDATVNIHLTKHLAELPLDKALEPGLTTQALRLSMTF